jgi:hypothetical protein
LVTPAYINAAATIKRKRKGSILIKNKTGSPLERRMNRIRNNPAPIPRIREIIGVVCVRIYYRAKVRFSL